MQKDRPLRVLAPQIDTVIRKNERYATRTGDTFYLVRTACNIGMRLLRGGDVPERRAAKARELARVALRFEGANVYAWALWRDALAAEGKFEAAELLGWETVRRFPEDPQWRTQLALLLANRLDQAQKAEALLRETIVLFSHDPKNSVFARCELALILADRLDRPQEAEVLLCETLKLFPNNVVAHTQLANVVGRDSARLKEAIALLDVALKIEPNDEIARSMRGRFERGQASGAPQPAPRVRPMAEAGAAVDLPVDLAASARMRRALFRVRTASPDAREAAKNEVQTILSEDENLAYARYIAAAAEITEPTSDDSVPAVAYLEHDDFRFVYSLSLRSSWHTRLG